MTTLVHKERGRQLAVALVIGLLTLATAGHPAWSQSTVPADTSAAIDDAIRVSEIAANNAAFSASIADAGLTGDIAGRTQLRVAQSNIAEAVVAGIAIHPQSVSAIVTAAVSRAPAHRDAIVHRAILAFPAFTAQIAAAAGVAPPAPTYMAMPNLTPAPSYVTAVQPVYGSSPTVVASNTTWVEPGTTSPAYGSSSPLVEMLRLDEARIGIAAHDVGVFGTDKESGPTIALSMRFKPLSGDMWDILLNPRPFIGANINTTSDTSAINGGVNWDWYFLPQTFASFSFGGTLHDGEEATTKLDRKELGSHALFYLAVELGYRIDTHNSLALRIDHMSNAKTADNNEGIDTVGIMYGYHF
jgi:lipid A 3-O-deacylase